MIHELVAKAAADSEQAEHLEIHLLSSQASDADRQLATALLISCAADPGADLPAALLDVVIELARQEAPAAVQHEISRHTATLLKLTRSPEPDLQVAALQVLGHGTGDPELAARLADLEDETAKIAAARLHPTFLLTITSPVTALVAARELGHAATAESAQQLAAALVRDPDALYELAWRDADLADLLAYLGDHRVAALDVIAAPASPVELRREAARAVRRLYPAGDLSVFIGHMLADDDELVRRDALRTICPSPYLALPFADRIAALLDDTPKNRRLATGGLLLMGDPRWKPYAAQVIRDGMTAKQLIQALEEEQEEPSAELKAAVSERVAELLQAGQRLSRDVQEINGLLRLARRWADSSLVPVLAQALPTADPRWRISVAQALADLGEDDDIAIQALQALAGDDLYFGYLAHHAGADPQFMREALLAADASNVKATLFAAELFGDAFPGIIERLEALRDDPASLKHRVYGASGLFHLRGENPPADLLDQALATLTGRSAQTARWLAEQTGYPRPSRS
ncbi:hypothetical protein Rhe02_28870 [Rhizocola hellebori]|uniref:HEAT repeat domain-containing protein n=1 Tax=Rhizocola hellebori TaxID=1392758 RepID=A0A8J3Q847_9ACTN|nr:hypothetical protein [Rhizocola hellebori]GIH04820.1 hypothetical protein Rhe02_28870 [Rhizocola hellebori]